MGKLSKLAGALKKAADIPDQVMIDGVMRATRNAKGQLIHPTSEGIENFWRYYKDGPIDKLGRPRVRYHGSKYGVKNFDDPDKAYIGRAFFTNDSDVAKSYSMGETPTDDVGIFSKNDGEFAGHVGEYYVPMKKPITEDITLEDLGFDEEDAAEWRDPDNYKSSVHPFSASMEDGSDLSIIAHAAADYPKFAKTLRELGYDGFMYDDLESGGLTVVPFEDVGIKSATDNIGAFDPANNDILGAATIGGMATAGAVGAGLIAAQAYDFGTPEYDAKIQDFRNRRAAKSQLWKELKEAGATIASAIPAGIVSDAYRVGGYLSPVTSLDETEQGAQAIQAAMTAAPTGENRFLNEVARQVDQFGRDIEPLVNAWQQTPVYRGFKQLPERAQRLIGTASEYLF